MLLNRTKRKKRQLTRVPSVLEKFQITNKGGRQLRTTGMDACDSS